MSNSFSYVDPITQEVVTKTFSDPKDFGWTPNNSEYIVSTDKGEDFINAFDGLGQIYNIAPPAKEKVFKDIVFSLDGKKYKFTVEEID